MEREAYVSTQRTCRRCFRIFPMCYFPVNNRFLSGNICYKHTCRFCRARIDKDRYRLHKFYLPPVPGPCPICQEHTTKWVLDHNHDTGRLRGWLCNSCNTGIGKLGDSVETLQRAIDYLKKQFDRIFKKII